MSPHKESKLTDHIRKLLFKDKRESSAVAEGNSIDNPILLEDSDDNDNDRAHHTSAATSATLDASGPDELRISSVQTPREATPASEATSATTQRSSGSVRPTHTQFELARTAATQTQSFTLPRTKRPASPDSNRRRLRDRKGTDVAAKRPRLRKLTLAEIARKWSAAAALTGASCITLKNDIDDTTPNVPDDFEWLEERYQPPTDYQGDDETDRRTPCTCEERCGIESACDCFDASSLPDGFRQNAYSKEGRLVDGLESCQIPFLVHECNDHCRCAPECRNRVAQRPRNVPLEIFKTRNRGWGVRTPIDLAKGNVLGIYTGDLSRRDEDDDDYDEAASRASFGDTSFSGDTTYANYSSDDNEDGIARKIKKNRYALNEHQLRESYEFNLDWDDAHSWVVGAYHRGNWTRFVNHSCVPNLRVYSMTYNTDPKATHLPTYLVFVTKMPIRAGQELTIDYNPRYASGGQKPSKNFTPSKASNSERCFCGATGCRGFMRQVV